MGPQKSKKIAVFLLLFFGFFSAGLEAGKPKIQSVRPDGSLVLEDGSQAVLAGLEMAPEAVPLLITLLSKGDIDIDYGKGSGEGPKPVYLSVKASENDFVRVHTGTDQRKVQINEFLIFWGAAKADTAGDYKEKEKYLELENQARRNGYGIWSYEQP